MARTYARSWPPLCDLLAEHFWPGPLTMIVPKNKKVDDIITAGHPTVGLRIPRHPLTLELITQLGEGLAAPSANKFGRTSPTCAEHVYEQFGKKVLTLDGGNCLEGIESTVCEVREKTKELLLYRPGPRTLKDIASLIANTPFQDYHLSYRESPVSPGHLKSHYQPEKPLITYRTQMEREQALKKIKGRIFECSLPNDPLAAARVLYKTLMSPESKSCDFILLHAPIDPSDERWRAVEDRLSRASTN